MLNILLAIPEAYYPRAEYVLRFCANAWGLPLTLHRNAMAVSPDLVYGTIEAITNTVQIPFEPQLYDPARVCAPIKTGERVAWSTTTSPDPNHYDVFGSIFRLLMLLDETQVAETARNDLGVFQTSALPDARREIIGRAVVDEQAQTILERLLEIRPELRDQIIPRWPDGKRYILCLTHDTDATWLSAPSELIYNMAKVVLRRDMRLWTQVRDGARGFFDRSFAPFFGFPLWQTFEKQNITHSSFYLFPGVIKVRRHLHDVRSTVFNSPADWTLLREMAKEGWEFGLHPAIHAKDNIDEFLAGKALIEDRLEKPIYGLRHHYLALDWEKPHLTFRKHVNAGFRYDASIAWDEVPGFRSSTSLPYQPFDPTYDRPLALYELPTMMLDGHIIPYTNRDSAVIVETGQQMIAYVRQIEGIAVLDWHTQTASSQYFYAGYLPILQEIIAPYVNSPEVWLATPWEIVQHWHQRANSIKVAYA